MFDLPTETKSERRAASQFRTFLQKIGFEKVQWSVYTQFTGTMESSQKYVKAVQDNCPEYGDINILFFTDKQFANIIHISNRSQKKLKDPPTQFELF